MMMPASHPRVSCWFSILTLLVGLAIVARPADAAAGEFHLPTGALAAQITLDAREQALRAAVNAERARHGLAPLGIDAGLQRAARGHTADISQFRYFGHDWHDGTPFSTWVWRYTKCTNAGEILAWRSPQQTPGSAVQQWLGSPRHRAALLSGKWSVMGIELTNQHAAVEFGRRC